MVLAPQFVKKHGEYNIFSRNPSFEPIPIAFGKVASFIVQKPDGSTAIFAFAYSGLEALKNTTITESQLLQDAVKVIENYIDENKISNNQEYTFEYINGDYHPTENPGWWVKASPRPS